MKHMCFCGTHGSQKSRHESDEQSWPNSPACQSQEGEIRCSENDFGIICSQHWPQLDREANSHHEELTCRVSAWTQQSYDLDSQRRFRKMCHMSIASEQSAGIYDSVRQPYSYSQGLTRLLNIVERRFERSQILQIVRAISKSRLSLVAAALRLHVDDLLFAEQCLQRILHNYSQTIDFCNSPTIICRWNGEVAAAGKRFCALTGWKKEVLFGAEPNQNLNTGEPQDVTTNHYHINRGEVRGFQTFPSHTTGMIPVLLAHLLDNASLLDFYQRYGDVGFDNIQSCYWMPCKLLKYQVPESPKACTVPGRQQETTSQIAEQADGRRDVDEMAEVTTPLMIDCVSCWQVRFDPFHMPMLIEISFHPCCKPPPS